VIVREPCPCKLGCVCNPNCPCANSFMSGVCSLCEGRGYIEIERRMTFGPADLYPVFTIPDSIRPSVANLFGPPSQKIAQQIMNTPAKSMLLPRIKKNVNRPRRKKRK